MRIYVMRHGESEAMLDITAYERGDPAKVNLTRWGYDQAVGSGAFLKERYEHDPALKGRTLHIFYSPMVRTQQSKDGVMAGIGDGIKTHATADALLTEREHGVFNGVLADKYAEVDPKVAADLRSPDVTVRYRTKMPGGESLEDVDMRLQKFLEKVGREAKPNEDVLIITHGRNCLSLQRHLAGRDVSRYVDAPVPNSADIYVAEIPAKGPVKVERIHEARTRPSSMAQDYKTEPYEGKGAHYRAPNGSASRMML